MKHEGRTLHIRHIHLQGDMNSNKIEKLNGKIRYRGKVMRGLKKKTDTSLLKGYEIYHNYFKKHMSLDDKTPSEKCRIEINRDNKWITLIQNASHLVDYKQDTQQKMQLLY